MTLQGQMTDMGQTAITDGKTVLEAEADALRILATGLDDRFAEAVQMILSTKGRLVVAGIGKSGHVARKIAATFASTGTPAYFVHGSEASHGDMGMIVGDDTCLLLSKSGETSELSDLVGYTRRFGIRLISITANPESTLAQKSDVALVLPNVPEVCAIGMAPTTSTTLSLALGDALAVAVMKQKGFDPASFHRFHPGGKLGAQFLRVGELMYTGDAVPLVAEDAAMPDVLMRMTGTGYGVAIVVRDGVLCGIITDGDLRRMLQKNPDISLVRAKDIMSTNPKTIPGETLAVDALQLMRENNITQVIVVDNNQYKGIVHLHDILNEGII